LKRGRRGKLKMGEKGEGKNMEEEKTGGRGGMW